MPYPEMMVAPMRAELTISGFNELKTTDEVIEKLDTMNGLTLLAVNSVCGCAAGSARPGLLQSLDNENTPNELYTVFAGQDLDAVTKAREYMLPYPPSSPSIALFKDGKLVHFIERLQIEGRTAEMIATNLKAAYNEFK